MSTVLSASAPTSFEIKSAQLPLVALLLKTADLGQLAEEMTQRYGDIPDFFDHDPLLVDLGPLQAGEQADSPVDFPALVSLLRRFRLEPMAVRGGNGAQTAAAELAGLMPAQDATVQRSAAARTPEAPVQQATPAAPAPVSAPVPTTPPSALVIDKPLRSGQQVYARGRDLVVLAMVNPGAEVIADGHIHVYAPLRGKAIAGARGNAEARIFAMSMDPELISIAGIYRTSDTPLPAEVLGKPGQVRLVSGPEGDKLVIESLNP
ncbi:septum site-determining protein MinC [Hydrogenophaga pseudoflava]|uniref:Probable septum site-determining protein MinC n=1 Tax=Hydrogenophaga pseudoflava TaxID=47421 RepID=A0A4P6WUH5_HYDPS|nr:septum site-determining protein MinC [Hydrogenophaga pseudoflava]QBM26136.1 Septum site-determining protein MinC [Hydrogenophaga pseudoflava]